MMFDLFRILFLPSWLRWLCFILYSMLCFWFLLWYITWIYLYAFFFFLFLLLSLMSLLVLICCLVLPFCLVIFPLSLISCAVLCCCCIFYNYCWCFQISLSCFVFLFFSLTALELRVFPLIAFDVRWFSWLIFVFTMFVDIMSCFQTFSVFDFLLFSQLAFNPFRRFFVDLWSSHFIFYALLWLFMIFFESHWFPFICNDFCEFLWIYSIFFVDLLSSSLILFEVLWFS